MAVGLTVGGNDGDSRFRDSDGSVASNSLLSRSLFLEGKIDVQLSPSPAVPPQGRTPTAAAEEPPHRQANVGRVVGELAGGDVALGGTVSYTALGEIVAQYDWMPEAFRVVDCESHWNPDAVSWDGSSWGLWQVNAVHAYRWPDFWESWDDPVRNTQYAWELYQEQGWGIWSCYQ